jgi:RimJ/RimL family protein N-acetyltransferase
MVRRGSDVNNRRMRDVKLSDGIVTLSPLRVNDVDAHLAGEDDLLVRWLSGGPGTRQGVEDYIRHCLEQWDIAGPLRAFAIRSDAGDALAGTIDLRFAQEGLAPGQVNVAYGLYPSWRGQGLATRAVQLVSQYAASEGAAEAVIRVEPENSVSAAVALRAGFVHRERVCAEDGTWLDWYVRNLGEGWTAPATSTSTGSAR